MEKVLEFLIKRLEGLKKSIVQNKMIKKKLEQEQKQDELNKIACIVEDIVHSENEKLLKKLSLTKESIVDYISTRGFTTQMNDTKKSTSKILKKKKKKKKNSKGGKKNDKN